MSQIKPSILVTGGAGYIGSHTVLALKNRGYKVLILDNLSCGHQNLVDSVLKTELIVGDIGDRHLLAQLFSTHSIDAVIHFAAHAYVGESVREPRKYYRNNLAGSLNLFETMLDYGIKNLVFSSTCATYGIPDSIPIVESQPQHPINPYGASKLAVERILLDFDQAYDFPSVIFRYFNAAGADPEGRLGEDHDPEPHLIPLILYTALGKRPHISIYGSDYPTPDGTCIRDYIHVSDLATAHVLGVEYLLQGGKTEIFNLGNGDGFSVRQVIDTAQIVTQCPIPVLIGDRRPGDPPILVGSSEKAQEMLGWQPQYPQATDIIRHAWHWHQKRHC